MKSLRSKRKAFTLLETTMAMYVTLVGVLTFACMAVFANKVGMQAKIRSGAYQVANQQLDVLRTTSFDNLQAMSEVEFIVPDEFVASLPGGSNTKYQVAGTYTIADLSNTGKQISVRVRWRSAATPEGQTPPWSEVRLTTLFAKPGSVTAGAIN